MKYLVKAKDTKRVFECQQCFLKCDRVGKCQTKKA